MSFKIYRVRSGSQKIKVFHAAWNGNQARHERVVTCKFTRRTGAPALQTSISKRAKPFYCLVLVNYTLATSTPLPPPDTQLTTLFPPAASSRKGTEICLRQPPTFPDSGLLVAEQLTSSASSSSKKRRLAPFDPTASDYAEEVHFDQQGLQAHTTSSPSSSPRPPSFTNTSDSNSQAPSPPSSVVIHNTSPPRTLPAHIHEEVLLSKEAAGGQAERGASPSGQFAAIQIGGEVMVGEEHGGNGNEQRGLSSPQRVLGARSASPAKRTAADMEDAGAVGRGGDRSTLESVPGSFVKVQDGGPTDFDQQMRDMAAASTSTDTQESTQHSAATSEPQNQVILAHKPHC
ncbi:hypothetical protein LTR91_002866 [Friedmanniomyces endolithicus]|uniref:Uncharacterized protein n=1 Tax=Friedmanniomyces endolithicus TaxID=329885 RepID=A0AAN6KYV7_9PEZI|nr:hypothetical protein LTR57_004520 [Friedmanniomyces endolithicus]KAK1009216.1 hypothetical protein LTR91_002866 [Friedmanniomyces endolithicus]